MKRILFLICLVLAKVSFAFQQTSAQMPPEETRPSTYWPWIIGFVIAIGAGMLLYLLIKKDPKKDVPR